MWVSNLSRGLARLKANRLDVKSLLLLLRCVEDCYATVRAAALLGWTVECWHEQKARPELTERETVLLLALAAAMVEQRGIPQSPSEDAVAIAHSRKPSCNW